MKTRSALLTLLALLASNAQTFADTVYAINQGLSTIEKFDSVTGQFQTFASGLYLPDGLAVDASGNVYVASTGNNAIEKFSQSGNSLGVFASGYFAKSLAFDSSGNLYAANARDDTIEKFSPSGTHLATFASGVNHYPSGLAFDSQGGLYQVNSLGFKIEAVSSQGASLFAAIQATPFGNPIGLAFDANDNLFVSLPNLGVVNKFSPAGTDLGVFASGLENPWGMAFGSSGNLFVASYTDSFRGIYEIDSSGAVINTHFNNALVYPTFLAVQTVPEPSAISVLAIGSGLFVLLHRYTRDLATA